MMKVKTLLALSAFFTTAGAHAGWYVVDNYTGTLGAWPIHLSVQQYDSYGSGLNIKGSYYYDKHRAPIPLYGRQTATTFELCEIHSPAEFDRVMNQGTAEAVDTRDCPFRLTREGDRLQGEWQQGTRRYPVTLQHTASLDNTAAGSITGDGIDIPFWGQTASHSFIGHYQTGPDGIVINRVSVLNKKTGRVDQILDPQQHQCDFGFYMTAIYQNIESLNQGKRVTLNCYSQKADISVDYRFDPTLQRYRTDDTSP